MRLAGLAAGGVGEGLVVGPSWVHAEPFDVVVLLWAAGLGGLVLADGLRRWITRGWQARVTRRDQMSARWRRQRAHESASSPQEAP